MKYGRTYGELPPLKEQEERRHSLWMFKSTIYMVDEAKEVAKFIFESKGFLNKANSLTDEEALAIANEEYFWQRIFPGNFLRMFEKLKKVQALLKSIADEDFTQKHTGKRLPKLSSPYHFQRRVVERFSMKEIERKVKSSIKNVRVKAVELKSRHMAVVIEKKIMEDDIHGFSVAVTLEPKGLILVTMFIPEKEEKSKPKQKKKKKGKKTRAEIRAAKLAAQREEE